MKKNKNLTYHSYERLKERTTLREDELKRISYYAIKNGLDFSNLPSGDLKSYVGRKIEKKNKRVKLYRGYVFIFFLNSKRMITCYPIPEKHLKEYEKIKNKKEK